MSGEAKRVGNWGEALTAEYLRGKGYHILDSGFRCQEGEIDLIAQKGDTLAFVEVKTRRWAGGGKLAQTAEHYRHGLSLLGAASGSAHKDTL